MTRNWPVAQTQGDWMRQQEKRMMHSERRPNINSASDLLGPGFAPTAVEVFDWNADEPSFNGFFFSAPGAINSPDGNATWLGITISQDMNFGVQRLLERDAGREYVRRFSVSGANTRSYTAWVSAASYSTPLWTATAAAATVLTTAVWTAVPMDTIAVDDFALGVSTGTYPGGFTVPVAGRYRAHGTVTFATSTLGTSRACALLLNASTFPEGGRHLEPYTSTANLVTIPSGTAVMSLTVGDVLRIQAFQNIGANLSTSAGAGLLSALFVQKIG